MLRQGSLISKPLFCFAFFHSEGQFFQNLATSVTRLFRRLKPFQNRVWRKSSKAFSAWVVPLSRVLNWFGRIPRALNSGLCLLISAINFALILDKPACKRYGTSFVFSLSPSKKWKTP